ncbi:hypothetical protein HY496_02060 [Candidatus Woesearchaeota archaeon]|nr:hypothetical protein [Candidatus Woesearchaeota archaeon]
MIFIAHIQSAHAKQVEQFRQLITTMRYNETMGVKKYTRTAYLQQQTEHYHLLQWFTKQYQTAIQASGFDTAKGDNIILSIHPNGATLCYQEGEIKDKRSRGMGFTPDS